MANILLIEDDDLLRKSVRRALTQAGHAVSEASNGKVAMAEALATHPHLVITDINMPDMDGMEVIMAMRRTSPGVPVIAMSGGGILPKELLLQNAGALGADATLTKPVEMEALLATVDSVLARSRE